MKKPNIYASGGIDRAARLREDSGWVAARLGDPLTRVAPVWRGRNLVDPGNGGADDEQGLAGPVPHLLAPDAGLLGRARAVALLGLVDGVAHFAADISHLDEAAAAAIGHFEDLRNVGLLMSHGDGALLAYARGIMHWHLAHLHCGRCGAPTESRQAGHVRYCTDATCAAPVFPRTDPAVIMLVHHGDHILLGRQKVWMPGMQSVLAGFVEPGESLEDAVAREVMEEAGVEIEDITYHSSQPWPFPASIMLGFSARATAWELTIDTDELESGRWFHRDEILASPEDESFRLPRRDSISYRLIKDWLDGAG